jgi:hypothetical protein
MPSTFRPGEQNELPLHHHFQRLFVEEAGDCDKVWKQKFPPAVLFLVFNRDSQILLLEGHYW